MYDAVADDYCYPGTTVLKNKLGLHDVYDWAGEVRTVRISKDGSMFCYPENIAGEAAKLFARLKQDNSLTGLSPDEFAGKSAHFLSELNAIHAFREGNGRAQLAFFLLLADQAGYSIDLEKFDPKAFLDAMIKSFKGDETPLAAIVRSQIENDTGRQ